MKVASESAVDFVMVRDVFVCLFRAFQGPLDWNDYRVQGWGQL